MATFNVFNVQYPWVLPTAFALILLFSLFLRRRLLAARATRVAQGESVTAREWNRARIQFIMTLGCVILLFVIWILQTYFSPY
jgi:putative copper export protein